MIYCIELNVYTFLTEILAKEPFYYKFRQGVFKVRLFGFRNFFCFSIPQKKSVVNNELTTHFVRNGMELQRKHTTANQDKD